MVRGLGTAVYEINMIPVDSEAENSILALICNTVQKCLRNQCKSSDSVAEKVSFCRYATLDVRDVFMLLQSGYEKQLLFMLESADSQ